MKAYMASEKLTLWVSFQIPTTSAGFPLQKKHSFSACSPLEQSSDVH